MIAEKKLKALTNSALWAAYGDALGFITELATPNSLKYRTNVNIISNTISWNRTIGGKFGAKVLLSAGTYSDDTQLRLATSRAIRSNGEFDVEAFAKIELPVWLSYALGAGRGSKDAANSLTRQSVNWFSNFYESKNSTYINGGGNGAAMRIQPHVWAAKNVARIDSYLPDVVKNSVCTHGHARGILGSAFHAICLADTINKDRNLTPVEWLEIANFLPNVLETIKKDINLSTLWLPSWEAKSQQSLKNAFLEVRNEVIEDINIIQIELQRNLTKEITYINIVNAIGASSPEQKGSATKTALLASVLSYLYMDSHPLEAMITCVNYLESDTDTIATMAGALLGVTCNLPPEGEIQDKEYIIQDIERLYAISTDVANKNFNYPDLLHWQAPKSPLDAIGVDEDNNVILSGVGRGVLDGPEFYSTAKNEEVWQMLNLEFGQSILCKRRKNLKNIKHSNMPSSEIYSSDKKVISPMSFNHKSHDLFSQANQPISDKNSDISDISLDKLTAEAIKSEFDPTLIGLHILDLSSKHNGIELSIAYIAIIAKARLARLRRT